MLFRSVSIHDIEASFIKIRRKKIEDLGLGVGEPVVAEALLEALDAGFAQIDSQIGLGLSGDGEAESVAFVAAEVEDALPGEVAHPLPVALSERACGLNGGGGCARLFGVRVCPLSGAVSGAR